MRRLKTIVNILCAGLCVGLAASGCGDGDGALGESATVTGNIDSWSEGAGYSVSARAFDSQLQLTEVASGTIEPNGAFSLVLPKSEAITPYLSPYSPQGSAVCSSQPTVAPLELRALSLVLFAKKAGSPDIALLSTSGKPSTPMAGDTGANFLYADRDAKISGQAKCDSASTSMISDYALELHKGWNIALTKYSEYSISPSGGRIVSETHNGSLPAEVRWQKAK